MALLSQTARQAPETPGYACANPALTLYPSLPVNPNTKYSKSLRTPILNHTTPHFVNPQLAMCHRQRHGRSMNRDSEAGEKLPSVSIILANTVAIRHCVRPEGARQSGAAQAVGESRSPRRFAPRDDE